MAEAHPDSSRQPPGIVDKPYILFLYHIILLSDQTKQCLILFL